MPLKRYTIAAMLVAIEGCLHGELDRLYDTIRHTEQANGIKVDLLLVCGDFQSVRNEQDLACLACPDKFKRMNTFWKYYSGECTAPVLTIFVGGNHEASNYLYELSFGGWVAPNIYYLGNAGVLNFGGLRIGGLSGIFKRGDYHHGHHEMPPYNEGSMRSAYHVRAYDVYKLSLLRDPLDIFVSHDWPRGIALHGNTEQLLRRKSFLREEVQSNSLGNPHTEALLHQLKPDYWFAAHLHVKFPAIVKHPGPPKTTKFLALGKVEPGQQFLQILHFPDKGEKVLSYDVEWLAVTRALHSHMSVSWAATPLPSQNDARRAVEAELTWVEELKKSKSLNVPLNFCQTGPTHDPAHPLPRTQPSYVENPQTVELMKLLDLECPLGQTGATAAYGHHSNIPETACPPCGNPDEIDLDGDEGNPDEIDLDGDEGNPDEIDLDGDEGNPEEIDLDG